MLNIILLIKNQFEILGLFLLTHKLKLKDFIK